MSKDDFDNDDETYEVGYGKPPKSGQFQPGKSGNPKGRPKGSKNLKTTLEEELNQKIFITEGKIQKQVTKMEAVIKRMVNDAIAGKPAPTRLLLQKLSENEKAALEKEEKTPTGAVVVPAGVPAEHWEALYSEKAKGTYRPDLNNQEELEEN